MDAEIKTGHYGRSHLILAHAPFATFATLNPSRITTNIVLIGTAVALDTIIKIFDAFFAMFAAYILGRVLMASVAGIALIVVIDMACRT